MIRRSVLAAVFALSAVAVSVAPAQAVTLPPPGENLIVLSYYRNGNLVGQKWWGCPGQQPGQWGDLTPPPKLGFVPC